MSAWPNTGYPSARLSGAEGELISVTVTVEPRLLERLLEALAGLDFPINPQIYHQGAVVYIYDDGRRTVHPATLVEFPAYAGRLGEVRRALESIGLDAESLTYRSMLEEIHADPDVRPAPPGAAYRAVVRYKHAAELQTH